MKPLDESELVVAFMMVGLVGVGMTATAAGSPVVTAAVSVGSITMFEVDRYSRAEI